MAKQESVLKFAGSIEDISFFKTKYGYQARKKTGVSASKIKNDPAFARTRENMLEFATANKTAKLVRNALREIIIGSTDGGMTQRLNKKMHEMLRKDSEHPRGLRVVNNDVITDLREFEFNIDAPLSTVFLPQIVAEFQRETSTCSVNIEEYIPKTAVAQLEGATHYRIKTGAALLDFGTGTYVSKTAQTGYLPLDVLTPTSHLLLEVNLDVTESSLPLPAFSLLTLEFFLKSSDNQYYPLQVGAFNACKIVEVFTAE